MIEGAPNWAIRQGLVPVDIDQLQAARFGGPTQARVAAGTRLAALYATLGEYEQALALDRQRLSAQPGAMAARRRVVWCLLRLDRPAEADAAAEALRRAPPNDWISQRIASAAKRAARTPRKQVRAQLVARLPLFSRSEAFELTRRVVSATPRPPRGRNP